MIYILVWFATIGPQGMLIVEKFDSSAQCQVTAAFMEKNLDRGKLACVPAKTKGE